jgi:hypothetical protein
MGSSSTPNSVLLVVAVSSRYEAAMAWAREQCEARYGAVALSSAAFDFTETDYYTATMGAGLKKQFLAFESLIDPGRLADVKQQTNVLEQEYAATGVHPESRPLNLDPGYITPAKLVLASTKDHAHRLYLRDGIYAEITLAYRHRHWQPMEWTYPDYRREDFQEFFSRCRERVLNCGRGGEPIK